MNAEILQIISIAAFILEGILLAIAVLLFFILDVPSLTNDLSGKTAQRQILKLREQNRQKEDRNEDRLLFESYAGKTDVTAKFPKNEMRAEETTMLELPEQETTLLKDTEGTTVLAAEEETTLLSDKNLILNVMIIHTKERI